MRHVSASAGLHGRCLSDAYRTSTFLARVLNLTPSPWTTVMETYPVFPVLISLTIPDFPSCVPRITLQLAPSFNLLGPLGFMLLTYHAEVRSAVLSFRFRVIRM